jgi:hypothetical protein
MYYKVKIKSLPKAKVGYQVDGSLKNDVTSFGGKNNGLQDHSNVKVTKSITAVPRKDANLEAEGGETVIGNIDGSKIPSFFNIEGPRHTKGGVPLNLPDDSFIFSDTRAMMINDPVLLKMFNMPTKKGGYTPAEMSKKFDINRYREILQDRNSDKLDIKTAEMMIKNYVIKLGALALAQESRKGFPQGIPKLSEPYMEANGITEEDLIPQKENPKDQQQSNNNGAGNKKEKTKEMPNGEPTAQPQEEMMQYGGGIRRLRRAQKGGPKDTIIYPPGDSEYMNQPPLNYDILEMLNNKRRLEYNDYMRDQRDPTNINNAPPAYRERFLAKPKTVQAQEGMQQPSEEEMMMMQQQQAQQEQQPQQGGQDQQMMQIMQQVAEALQQGAQPEELTAELLQGQVPPEAIMQIFAQLGMPENQVQQLVMSVMQQMQGGQEQDPRQQQQQMSEEDMMAMQQQDPRQMQQAPMAAYGMSMGGYDMPDYMAYGGSLRKAQNGEEVKGKTGNIKAGKVETIGPGYTRTTTTSGKEAGYKLTEGEKRANAKGAISGGGGGRPSAGWEDAICEMIKAGATYEQLTNPDVAFEFTGSRKTHMAPGAKSKAIFDRCNVNASKFEDKEEAVYIDKGGKKCICLDKDGKAILDENGAEIPTSLDPTTGECIQDDPKCNPKADCVPGSDKYKEEKAKCDAKGLEFDGPKCQCKEKKEECTPGTDLYNSRKAICDEKGEEFDPSTCDCIPIPPPRKPPEWWLQDNVNVMGAASDLASVKKYMPWEARVDLEEPRPTFLDPTRELAAQSEQANIASQASASFAGAQGLGARNAATQGNAAAQAANTLSNINNQNVNIANQFEGTQVGIRNQESMLNQQMANRVYDKNTIANQQFDNAKLQGRQNLRNSYNTAVTNKWKTDALNQMYPNYQTEAGPGGRVTYTPTDKKLDPSKRKNAYEEAKVECQDQGLAGADLTRCIDSYMKHNSKYGGESFEHGGFVYTVYPNY